jgi:predicted NAD/FAD-binding protein
MQSAIVIGSGISGIMSAYLLQKKYQVTLIEKSSRLGGHTHTVTLEKGPDAGLSIDTGFIVFNDRTYPHFIRFLNELQVPYQPSDMSFSYESRSPEFYYNGTNLSGLFAQKKNLVSPSFYKMLKDILRFNEMSLQAHREGSIPDLNLGDYLRGLKCGQWMIERYIVPMAAAIWSSSPGRILDFPARTFIHFFVNHGLLEIRNRPQWYTVTGGSHRYIQAFLKNFKGKVMTSANVTSISRDPQSVRVICDGAELKADILVLAAHADESLSLLGANAHPSEQGYLSEWAYSKNEAVLHTDVRWLPKNSKAWASWNVIDPSPSVAESRPVCLTYHMNRLQRLKTQENYCVTLNPFSDDLDESKVIKRIQYTHPLYTSGALKTQAGLKEISGERRTYFAGAYLGYGFHEDGVRSAVEIAHKEGISW